MEYNVVRVRIKHKQSTEKNRRKEVINSVQEEVGVGVQEKVSEKLTFEQDLIK